MSLEGIADLPLHEGHVPQWLAKLMKRLAKAILTIMVDEFGPDRVVERLSNPLWFQAFNNVIGMDWDSSGSTTVTTAILKEVTWENPDLGLLVLGGKGSRARQIPLEIPRAVKVLNLGRDHSSILERVSKFIPKISLKEIASCVFPTPVGPTKKEESPINYPDKHFEVHTDEAECLCFRKV